MDRNVILIGMPGVGKSTVGPLLAGKLKMQYADVDAAMASTKRELQTMVDQMGLAGFLALEEQTLLGIGREGAPLVIITGGSAVFSEAAMAFHARRGVFVYLRAPVSLLRERVDFTGGGLAKEEGQSLEDLYRQREPYYEKYADIRVDIDNKSAEAVADAIAAALRAGEYA